MSQEPADRAYQRYFQKIEIHWGLARGKQIIVSTLEFDTIQKWYMAGVPASVVMRAADLFLEKKRKGKRQRQFLLTHVDGMVQKCHREFITLHTGEGEESDLLGSKMKRLIAKLKKLEKETPEMADVLAQTRGSLGLIDLHQIVTYEDVDRDLQEHEGRLIAAFSERLDEEQMAAIRSEIEEFLTADEDPELFQKMVDESVRSHFGLPKLTLLG